MKGVPRGFCRALQSWQEAVLPSSVPDSSCRTVPMPVWGSSAFQRQTASAGFAKACEGPCFSPERSRTFTNVRPGPCFVPGRVMALTGLYQRPQGAVLPSRVPSGFCRAFPRPMRGFPTCQRAWSPLPSRGPRGFWLALLTPGPGVGCSGGRVAGCRA